jgi:hypothetical protein
VNAALCRMLILGCIAIVLLELPGVIADWRFGDGFEALAATESNDPAALHGIDDNPLADLVKPAAELLLVEADPGTLAMHVDAMEAAMQPVELVSVPGL